MADRQFLNSRHTAASRAAAQTAGSGFVRPRPAGSASTTTTTAASTATAAAAPANARRNLFQSQLRRTDDGRADRERERDQRDKLELQKQQKKAEPVEIVVRDRNGDIVLVEPPSPTADELNEMMAAPPLDARHENERERQRLADTIKYHQQRTNIPGQPEELLEALRASLRAKVAALSEDNWMYEPEDMPRVE